MGGAFGSDVCSQSAPRGRQVGCRSDVRTGAVRAFGGLQIVDLVYAETAGRPHSATDGAGDGAWLLILNLEGTGTFVSGDRVFALAAGDLLLVDRRVPLRREAAGGCRDVRVQLPGVPAREGYALPLPGEPCLIDGRDAIGTVLRELIRALLFAEDPFCRREEEAVRDAILALVAAAYCVRRDCCQRRARKPARGGSEMSDAPRQWRRLAECVEAQLSDPALSPATVAAMRGVSTRHLHRLFRQAGVSFGSFVRRRRLERCREDLADPRFDGLPLTEIAYRWGFSDSSHFSRCFRSAFGCTARDFRARQARVWPASFPAAEAYRSRETAAAPENSRTA